MVRTLHIPPAETEFYGGPQEGWLRELLDRLPSLQSLIVSRLSFFDHQSLGRIDGSTQEFYELRLLVAANCENTTASSLASALFHFPKLIYLDLSSSQGARNPLVLQRIISLESLQVLKLRDCGLKDSDSEYLSFESSSKIRSLDLSHNHLSENGIYNIIHRLMPDSSLYKRAGNASSISRSSLGSNQWPTTTIENLESFVSTGSDGEMNGQHFDESTSTSGLSYIYISNNELTLDSATRALQLLDLRLLDCGSLNGNQRTDLLASPKSRKPPSLFNDLLDPNLFIETFKNIATLRIHHSIITRESFTRSISPLKEQCFELHGEELRFELDSTPIDPPDTHYELDIISIDQPKVTVTPCWESPDSVGSSLLSGLSLNKLGESRTATLGSSIPAIYNSDQMPRIQEIIRPNSPTSPVCYLSYDLETENIPSSPVSPIHPLTPSGPETCLYKYHVPSSSPTVISRSQTNTQEIISEIIQRRHRLESRERHPSRLKPSMLPNLKKLTLIDIPTKTKNRHTIDGILLFLQECAEEEEIARLEASLNPTNKRPADSNKLYKIQKIIFEISRHSEPEDFPPSPGLSPSRNLKRESFTKSSTEDVDSENFMTASERDFSFFGEDDGGLLVSEGGIDLRRGKPSDGLICDDMGRGYAIGRENVGPESRIWDVVHEIKNWRREKREAYNRAIQAESPIVVTALMGHWRGEVAVVRVS